MSDTKELLVRTALNNPTAFEVYYGGGGELPDVLKDAQFTHRHLAQEQIDKYLSTKSVGAKKNGNTRAKSRTV